MSEAPLNEAERRAVSAHFEGDHGLFIAFKASSRAQFESDARVADASLTDAQRDGFRRVMHSLKSVFQLLGEDDLSLQARQLESDAAEASLADLRARWDALKRGMRVRGLMAS